MGYEYYFGGRNDEAMAIFGGAFIVSLLIPLVIMVAFYVVEAIGMYKIAKGRGMTNAFLAWIPVANAYLLGQITDDINLRTRGKHTRQKVALLVLNIATIILLILFLALLFGLIFALIKSSLFDAYHYNYRYSSTEPAVGFALLLVLCAFAMLGAAIAYAILFYIALYRIYNDYIPQNAVLFLVLSILFGIYPFFLLAISNKPAISLYGASSQPFYPPQNQGYQGGPFQSPTQGTYNPSRAPQEPLPPPPEQAQPNPTVEQPSADDDFPPQNPQA